VAWRFFASVEATPAPDEAAFEAAFRAPRSGLAHVRALTSPDHFFHLDGRRALPRREYEVVAAEDGIWTLQWAMDLPDAERRGDGYSESALREPGDPEFARRQAARDGTPATLVPVDDPRSLLRIDVAARGRTSLRFSLENHWFAGGEARDSPVPSPEREGLPSAPPPPGALPPAPLGVELLVRAMGGGVVATRSATYGPERGVLPRSDHMGGGETVHVQDAFYAILDGRPLTLSTFRVHLPGGAKEPRTAPGRSGRVESEPKRHYTLRLAFRAGAVVRPGDVTGTTR
jgi:hypothetical protein